MRLHFQEFGQGASLIILHGLFGSLDNWATIGRQLAGHFHVFTVDQRNHGHSPHSPEMNYSVMADDLDEFMQRHRLASASVLGHSLGGKTAMQFALLYPGKVEKLLVADISPQAYPPAHEPIFNALLALDLKSFQTRQQIEKALAPLIPEPDIRRFLLKNVTRGHENMFHWKLNLRDILRNYSRLNEAVNADRHFDRPALFIRGGKSDYISEQDLPAIRRLFPHAEIRTIPDAGHWVQADAPGTLVRLVLDFFGV
jgi:pimeloyl-ACP methyl ester carboxylesterase